MYAPEKSIGGVTEERQLLQAAHAERMNRQHNVRYWRKADYAAQVRRASSVSGGNDRY
jgi:hypothetical protein